MERIPRKAEFDRFYGGSGVRILQFYSADGNLIEATARPSAMVS